MPKCHFCRWLFPITYTNIHYDFKVLKCVIWRSVFSRAWNKRGANIKGQTQLLNQIFFLDEKSIYHISVWTDSDSHARDVFTKINFGELCFLMTIQTKGLYPISHDHLSLVDYLYLQLTNTTQLYKVSPRLYHYVWLWNPHTNVQFEDINNLNQN